MTGGLSLLTPMSTSVKSQPTVGANVTPVGSTWAGAGLNIDLNNIMGGKAKQSGPAPSMNQLASNSPQHQPKGMGKSEVTSRYFARLNSKL